jgi:hypothetical protein
MAAGLVQHLLSLPEPEFHVAVNHRIEQPVGEGGADHRPRRSSTDLTSPAGTGPPPLPNTCHPSGRRPSPLQYSCSARPRSTESYDPRGRRPVPAFERRFEVGVRCQQSTAIRGSIPSHRSSSVRILVAFKTMPVAITKASGVLRLRVARRCAV